MMSGSVAGIKIVPWRLLWMALPPLHSCGLVGHVYPLSIFYSFSVLKDPLIITERFSWSWISSHPRDVGSYPGLNSIHPYLAQWIKGDLYPLSGCLVEAGNLYHSVPLSVSPWSSSMASQQVLSQHALSTHSALNAWDTSGYSYHTPNWENLYVKGSLLLWFEYKMTPTQSSYFQYLVPIFWYYLRL